MDAPARVQVGFSILLVGVAWLVAGLLLRRMGGAGRLRAFSGRDDWRWLGVLLAMAGLCVARPWGMDASIWVWLRHSALLVVVLLAGVLLSVGRKRDWPVALALVAVVFLQVGMSLWVAARLGGMNLAGVPVLGSAYVPDLVLLALAAAGAVALGTGLWRSVRAPLRAGALHTLGLLLMLPVFSETMVVTASVDRQARMDLHLRAIDPSFGRQSIPAGLHLPTDSCSDGIPVPESNDPCAE